MVNTLQAGYKFSRTWPINEPYLAIFQQTKSIKLVNLLLMITPAIALVTIWLQLDVLGFSSLNTALAMSLLILSIPFHGLFILGKQATETLPVGLKNWYFEIEDKLKQQSIVNQPIHQSVNKSKLTYMDLAELLKKLFQQT